MVDREMDPDHIRELFASFGPVTVRRMFGGAGIYADGTMFALIAGNEIFLKADSHTIPNFERESLGPFSYATKDGRHSIMSYWRMPERLYDDPDELARWARAALETARRSGTRPKDKARRSAARPKMLRKR